MVALSLKVKTKARCLVLALQIHNNHGLINRVVVVVVQGVMAMEVVVAVHMHLRPLVTLGLKISYAISHLLNNKNGAHLLNNKLIQLQRAPYINL